MNVSPLPCAKNKHHLSKWKFSTEYEQKGDITITRKYDRCLVCGENILISVREDDGN